MQFRFCAPSALLIAVAALAGCSGGSGSSANVVAFACSGANAKALCLNNCSLGCSSTGCLRTDIAQNENLILQFSKDVDPASVNTSTIRLRTASGELPVGEFFVNRSQVEFVPTLLVSGGQTFFGFKPGETYTLTLPGGPSEPVTVRSTSGEPFKETLTCTLVANQGIKDHNGVPPTAVLVSPTAAQLGAAPLSTIIQLEFNEMVDATPFLAATGGNGPVTFAVRRTRIVTGSTTEERECDLGGIPVVLAGTSRLDFDPARGISVLTFRTNQDLSPNTCVEINVTSTVVDLSGKPAQPQSFLFQTVSVPLATFDVTEEFDNDNKLDHDVSSGTWANGIASFGLIGGDGRHGTFAPELGVSLGVLGGKRTFQFNTDSTIIPGSNTRTGDAIAVTDGKFYFDEMIVPGDVRLRFVGSSLPQITVSGQIDIQGEIDIQGQSLTTLPLNSVFTGQLGGVGGIGGGAGGQGGDKCLGTGYLAAYDGRNGGNAQLLGGRAYATSGSGTGGAGSHVFPIDGLNASLVYFQPTGVNYTPSASAGGGGAGMFAQGGIGRVVTNNHNDPIAGIPPRLDAMGPSALGGSAVQFFPFPATSGSTKSSVHFLVAGAGGGGAGSQAALCIAALNPRVWSPGGGGGGGGGAISLRSGDSLRLGGLGRILANGGGAASASGVTATSSPSVGGGGSGGSVVLQSGRIVDISGIIDVRGGLGGSFNRSAGSLPPSGAAVQIAGGDGSSGFVRCEVPGTPTTSVLANMLPAPSTDNVGTLTEADDLVGFQSTWYSTNLPFGPEFSHYEIHATVDGVPMVFSDNLAISTVIAGVGAPVRAFFQSANLDLVTGLPAPLAGQTEPTIRPWRTAVRSTSTTTGIASDGLNGFRFALIVDHALATTVTIDQVKVVYRV